MREPLMPQDSAAARYRAARSGARGLQALARVRHCIRLHRAAVAVREPRPVVAGAEERAERAGFDTQRVALFQRHRSIIVVAAGAAVDVAGPLAGGAGLRLHIDEDWLALRLGCGIEHEAAQRLAAGFNADQPVLAFGLPVADRRVVVRRPLRDARDRRRALLRWLALLRLALLRLALLRLGRLEADGGRGWRGGECRRRHPRRR